MTDKASEDANTEIAALVEHLSDVRRLLRCEGRNTSASYVTKAAAAILALQARVRELERYEPQSIHVRSAYCDCCAAPVPFDHICSCELEQA